MNIFDLTEKYLPIFFSSVYYVYMNVKQRYLYPFIAKDLKQKMVFLEGPRQVGKTTLAQAIAAHEFQRPAYYNWDDRNDRRAIADARFPDDADLIILDEVHKYRPWKNHVKGIWDTRKEKHRILVTGSARLDIYRRGGDSLLGRYHYHRLHPFTVGELIGATDTPPPFEKLVFPRDAHAREQFDRLFRFGGFPEPFFTHNREEHRRWQNEYVDRLIKDDVRDLEIIRDLSMVQLLVIMLPQKVASRLSITSIREDLEVSYNTVAHWIDVLERFYFLFRIYPYRATAIKSLRKEPKAYLWEWSLVEDGAKRLENMIAAHLLKFVHLLYDAHGWRADLWYLRDIDGREVDFLVIVNRKPWFAVEVKLSETEPSKHLAYFGDRLEIPFLYQVVAAAGVDFWDARKNISVMSADRFLSGLV